MTATLHTAEEIALAEASTWPAVGDLVVGTDPDALDADSVYQVVEHLGRGRLALVDVTTGEPGFAQTWELVPAPDAT